MSSLIIFLLFIARFRICSFDMVYKIFARTQKWKMPSKKCISMVYMILLVLINNILKPITQSATIF
jgi:hypothetical protein